MDNQFVPYSFGEFVVGSQVDLKKITHNSHHAADIRARA
jgi:hypothetical protein